ncbi:biotin/lipoyl-containing protein [Zobellella maritima]|uniref:biotin/lipoyl-containing protein n=1 Tax=Zobellella maritima TaxID=2059725 RepID=UPI000E302BF0|nr:lipoyl domain-containing protein [Zobellella maritima]
MSTAIRIPMDLWEEQDEAVITTWLSAEGEAVATGQVIAEIMVQKIQHDILAPASGSLSILKEADEVVAKGDLIGQVQ